MEALRRTVLFERHKAAGAKSLPFGGWEMPLMYPAGIVGEHLGTRKGAGIFDVSHMGRLLVSGKGAIPFLQGILTNNVMALVTGESQYTLLATETGGALDDAYLYRFFENEYLLVVNAANFEKDWDYLLRRAHACRDLHVRDVTEERAMLALQGPRSRGLLEGLLGKKGAIPEPLRNALIHTDSPFGEVWVARTGYAGEPVCFEIFADPHGAPAVWDFLVENGAVPAGLGARDTLRLEAGLPLYGHELGTDREGREIPIFALGIARRAVSFSSSKGEFVGKEALRLQHEAWMRLEKGDPRGLSLLPRRIVCLAVTGRGIARQGAEVYRGETCVGYVTSGTAVPFWQFEGPPPGTRPGDGHGLRALAMAYLASEIREGDAVDVDVRGRRVDAVVVPYHLRSDAPPYARPIPWQTALEASPPQAPEIPQKVALLLMKAEENTLWRQRQCMNLIPSEMTPSPMVRRLSVMDPAGRYAEHRRLKAFCDDEIFYYQGTDFIAEVERLLDRELREYLSCAQVETRPLSGQMANMVAFSGIVGYLNRTTERGREPRRLCRLLHHSLNRGGHLSAQPMGALKDFLEQDPVTGRPQLLRFPVLEENPYGVDIEKTQELLHAHRPELVIFGRSMALQREPVMAVREVVDALGLDTLLLYDGAHVFGLLGPLFQNPFQEGAHLLTASTHKTFFGPQRGVVAADLEAQDPLFPLWEHIVGRCFPGAVSNHHLGTQLGLLMAAYEMNHFRETYQAQVLRNAKAFAESLKACGLDVAGDPAMGYTETHQVILRVGYGRGPEAARSLERSGILCNYQATPEEEGFTAAGALRMGVAEMTRFGMEEGDFRDLAALLSEALIEKKGVAEEVRALRGRFLDMRYCFEEASLLGLSERLKELL